MVVQAYLVDARFLTWLTSCCLQDHQKEACQNIYYSSHESLLTSLPLHPSTTSSKVHETGSICIGCTQYLPPQYQSPHCKHDMTNALGRALVR